MAPGCTSWRGLWQFDRSELAGLSQDEQDWLLGNAALDCYPWLRQWWRATQARYRRHGADLPHWKCT
jgi:hypothetical protein